jgi:hypothetical protein
MACSDDVAVSIIRVDQEPPRQTLIVELTHRMAFGGLSSYCDRRLGLWHPRVLCRLAWLCRWMWPAERQVRYHHIHMASLAIILEAAV